ncbi:hypothetical protein ABT282_07070 [Streptomyces sp. NPDC000927]|uniref:hypothetical protein n=1 Tax=Streptomyces sp. NPDC000927 TaxID=3154371 RepID=UPI003319B8B2
MPKAATVSRFLAKKFQRSSSRPSRIKGMPVTLSGFEAYAHPDRPDVVVVEHRLGESLRGAPEGRRQEVKESFLKDYQEWLEERYAVSDNCSEGHPATKLHVRDKG